MDGHCDRHGFEARAGICRSCGGEFCDNCLVYSYGRSKPPYCVSCALAAAGVRSTAARTVTRSKREIKRELRLERRAAKARESNGSVDLAAARPLAGTRPFEFEFTIDDDGSVIRPAESRAR